MSQTPDSTSRGGLVMEGQPPKFSRVKNLPNAHHTSTVPPLEVSSYHNGSTVAFLAPEGVENIGDRPGPTWSFIAPEYFDNDNAGNLPGPTWSMVDGLESNLGKLPNFTTTTAATIANNTDPVVRHYELIWTPEVVFRVTAIILVMFLTLVGNSILISLILCHRKLRKKRVNIFLVNLAIGDLMVCFVTMTTEILFVAFGEWVLGEAACKVTVYGQIVTLASATFLLTAMSVDRYQVIVRPLQSLTGQPSICRKVVCAWVCAFLFATPQLFVFVQTDEGTKADGSTKHLCRSQGYTAPWQRKAYFTFMTTYILVIPTAIMTFCYVNIIRVVFMRTGRDHEMTPKLRFTSSRKGHPHQQTFPPATSSPSCYGPETNRKSSSESQNEIEYSLNNGGVLSTRWSRRRSAHAVNRLNLPNKLVSASKRKVVKMTLSVILAFLFCWSPYFIVGLIRIYSGYRIRLTQAYSVAEILAMLHSALNPILYGVFSTRSAVKILRNICCRKRKMGYSSRNICDSSLVGSEYESVVLGTTPVAPLKQQSLEESSNVDGGTCGCIRFIDKVCFYCSRGYKNSQTISNMEIGVGMRAKNRRKRKRQLCCHPINKTTTATTTTTTSNYRGITESTFVELSRVDSLAIHEVQLPREHCRDGSQMYGMVPYRVPSVHGDGAEGSRESSSSNCTHSAADILG